MGQAGFLYPFLGREKQAPADLVSQVESSILLKVADDAALRAKVAREEAEAVAEATLAIGERLRRGGRLLLFGNGGSATDANDWAIDCVAPPEGLRPLPALSLAMEPAILSAIANDVGTEVVFLRQLIAHAEPDDVAVAISTSGNSPNVIAAVDEAQRRGLRTIGLLGRGGGKLAGRVELALVVPSSDTQRIQECHIAIAHAIAELVDRLLFPELARS